MIEKLKPCPFCGNDNPSLQNGKWNGDAHPTQSWVECTDCDCAAESKDTTSEAIAMWNRRPLEDAKDAEIARLKEPTNESR